MRAPRVILVVLAFVCLCAAPSASFGQGSTQENPPTQLWKKFPFNPPPSRAKQGGAKRAPKSAGAPQPSRRSAERSPGNGSDQGTAFPLAVVLPLGVLLVVAAVAVPIAVRRRRGPAKGKSMLRTATAGSLGKGRSVLGAAAAGCRGWARSVLRAVGRGMSTAATMLRTAGAGSVRKVRSVLGAASPRRLRRPRGRPSPEHRTAPSPTARRPGPARPAGASASAPPAPTASAPPKQGGAGPAAPASAPPPRVPPPASVTRPAGPPPPRPAPEEPAAARGRSAQAKLGPDRPLTPDQGAAGSAAAGKAPARRDATARAVGYASLGKGQTADSPELRGQAKAIEQACATRGLALRRLVWDVARDTGSDLERPGLRHALEMIAAGEASCLVVAGLDRLSRSAADLGVLVEWLENRRTRLIAVDLDLDTAAPDGRLAARALAAVGGSTRTARKGLTSTGVPEARPQRRSPGRPAVADRPALEGRIRAMRAEGMTLQAIADTLNAEGVPTLRGGTKWRPSSVQAATGYKRPRRKARPSKHDSPDR
jgi:DNA invertase Pin-like site-specific DNA recombinase